MRWKIKHIFTVKNPLTLINYNTLVILKEKKKLPDSRLCNITVNITGGYRNVYNNKKHAKFSNWRTLYLSYESTYAKYLTFIFSYTKFKLNISQICTAVDAGHVFSISWPNVYSLKALLVFSYTHFANTAGNCTVLADNVSWWNLVQDIIDPWVYFTGTFLTFLIYRFLIILNIHRVSFIKQVKNAWNNVRALRPNDIDIDIELTVGCGVYFLSIR